ncbi:MAG: hypothetical protein QNK04_28665 [Myxococcota bacterium]|nr:hypothetical protein [Myxococcota bacterium]
MILAGLAAACLLLVQSAAAQEDDAPEAAAAQEEAAPEGGWDQQAAAKTSRDLQRALDALLSDPNIDARQATAMQQREHEAAIATAREIAGINGELARRLAAGYDRDETEAFWHQIALASGDLQEYARHSWLPEGTRQRAERAGGLLDQLAAYYESVE